jgi:predicted transcriptional regulator
MIEMEEVDTAILEALMKLEKPVGCKEIGEEAVVPWRKVMARLRSLKKAGLVDSPEKGRYTITGKGAEALG